MTTGQEPGTGPEGWVGLAQPLYEGMPVASAKSQVRIVPEYLDEGPPSAAVRITHLTLSTHVGTHVDAALHFVPGGRSIDRYPAEHFIGPGVVIDVPREGVVEVGRAEVEALEPDIREGDIVFFHFGYGSRFGTPEYRNHPYLAEDTALARRQGRAHDRRRHHHSRPRRRAPPTRLPLPRAHGAPASRHPRHRAPGPRLGLLAGRRIEVVAVPVPIRGATAPRPPWPPGPLGETADRPPGVPPLAPRNGHPRSRFPTPSPGFLIGTCTCRAGGPAVPGSYRVGVRGGRGRPLGGGPLGGRSGREIAGCMIETEAAMSGVSPTKPAGRATALVLSTLRAAILGGELSPGEQVRQQMWADRMGVSRPPLREALEILTNEGLLVHGLNQGYFVAKFSRDEMEQLYTMRLLLESEALEEIVWPTDAQLVELENVADDIEEHATSGRPDIALQGLAEFYLGVYALSPKKLIVDEVKRLWIRTAAYRSLSIDVSSDPGRSGQRLHVIVDVLRARDLPRLRELLLRPTLRGRSGVAVDGQAIPPGPDGRRVAG